MSGSGNSSPRVATRKKSFLSLRREKSSPPDPAKTPQGYNGPKQAYFDTYPKPPSRSIFRSNRDTRKPVPLPPRIGDSPTLSERSLPSQPDSDPEPQETFEFPLFEDPARARVPRPQTQAGDSRRRNWSESLPVPPLRFSGSSNETPPDTPTESIYSRGYDPLDFAAPTGVEAMDALVDGMNGYSGDEYMGAGASGRSRFGVHPLYLPPLPTPPPGVVLGGGKARIAKTSVRSRNSVDDEDDHYNSTATARPRRRQSHTSMANSITSVSIPRSASHQGISLVGITTPERPKGKVFVPSISDIIRTHAPPSAQIRTKPTLNRRSSYSYSQTSHGHATLMEEVESEPEPIPPDDELELLSRSSIDSIADEVQRTLATANAHPLLHARSFHHHHPTLSTFADDASLLSPRSDGLAPSIYASSVGSGQQPPSPYDGSFRTTPTPKDAIAQYLRSSRLTTLLKLTRSPHASQDNPLTVSLSDLGNATGYPVVVFLGLGCVRHVMGLYDEMAECLNLRVITIDRWGLGRTESRRKSARGIMDWALVVEEVLDLLRIDQCSVMAHSAGAPYALSFCNRFPERIRGDLCLLAPWVGGSESANGYKWLKYVPNGILKTAQAAEWKVQAWMIGKPPTMAYEGIGYTAQPTPPQLAKAPASNRRESPSSIHRQTGIANSKAEGRPRPSMGSNFSEYDDLGDFDGRFESRSTLGARGLAPQTDDKPKLMKRKSSRSFLGRLKSNNSTVQPQSRPDERPNTGGKRLKALRSMSSLKGNKSISAPSTISKKAESSPQLPSSFAFEVGGLAFDDDEWNASNRGEYNPSTPDRHRKVSLASRMTTTSPLSLPPSPHNGSFNSPYAASTHSGGPSSPGTSYQVALGNALIAASHAESSKGMHSDLLQILNHDHQPWGFSYASYPHTVRVWYGDKDEKIAENAVRWMEQTMGPQQCHVNVVKGADHGLMYKASVVIDVLEHCSTCWTRWCVSFYFLFRC